MWTCKRLWALIADMPRLWATCQQFWHLRLRHLRWIIASAAQWLLPGITIYFSVPTVWHPLDVFSRSFEWHFEFIIYKKIQNYHLFNYYKKEKHLVPYFSSRKYLFLKMQILTFHDNIYRNSHITWIGN